MPRKKRNQGNGSIPIIGGGGAGFSEADMLRAELKRFATKMQKLAENNQLLVNRLTLLTQALSVLVYRDAAHTSTFLSTEAVAVEKETCFNLALHSEAAPMELTEKEAKEGKAAPMRHVLYFAEVTDEVREAYEKHKSSGLSSHLKK